MGLSPEGYLIIQEDREGAVFGTIVQKKSFINGARHSVYYKRDKNDSELLIDRELIPMYQIPAQSFTAVPEMGANEVQIGGHNTTDPRFAIYKGYSGCLSSKYFCNVASNFYGYFYAYNYPYAFSWDRYLYRSQ